MVCIIFYVDVSCYILDKEATIPITTEVKSKGLYGKEGFLLERKTEQIVMDGQGVEEH